MTNYRPPLLMINSFLLIPSDFTTHAPELTLDFRAVKGLCHFL